MAKRVLSLLCALCLGAALLLTLCACATSDADQLVIYNWADYIYLDWEKDFGDYYFAKTGRNVEVTYVTFDTNETMLTKIQKGDAEVDAMCPSEYAIQKLIEGGYCIPLNYFSDDNYENNVYVDLRIKEKIDEQFSAVVENGGNTVKMSDYMVPYMWGTLGVLYNVDVMEANGISEDDIASAGWGVLWNQDADGNKLSPALDNRIFMKDSIRDVYAATVMYLKQYGLLPAEYTSLDAGALINTVDSTLLNLVESVLIKQKDILYGYEVDFGKNDLVAGNAYVDLAWSGDALYAIEEGDAAGVTLNYVSPSIGGNIWFDGWVVPTTCKNVRGAKLFIDFLNSPDVATQNMMEIGYTSAVDPRIIKTDEDVKAILEENEYDVDEFFDDVIRYPLDNMTEEDIANLGVMKDFGASNSSVVQMWERVRSTGISVWELFVLTLALCGVVVGIVWLTMFLRVKKRMRVPVSA